MAKDLTDRTYVRYDSGVTKIQDGEAENIQAIQGMFQKLLYGVFENKGHTYPTTHARTLAIMKGKLVVSDDLPRHLKQSLFAKGGEYPVVVRHSTASQDVAMSDRITAPRATSLRIFNVDGERFPEGAGNRTQDFEFNSGVSEHDLSDARTAKEVIGLRLMALRDPKAAASAINARPDAELQNSRDHVVNSRLESLHYYSQVAYRFGDYVAKHRLIPGTSKQQQLFNETVDNTKDAKASDATNPRVMGPWLQNSLAQGEVVYLWQFQLCENLEDQPVEYAGKKWDQDKYPYQTVAKLVFPKQDPINFELKSFWEDHVAMNTWRGLASLEPIGSTNRVRRVMYPYARKIRETLNGEKVIDIQSIEELPGPLPDGVPKSTHHGAAAAAAPGTTDPSPGICKCVVM